MADVNAISSAISGPQVAQSQQAAPQQPAPKAAAPQPNSDIVTISAQGKQAAQYSPTEEQKESSTQKASETEVGKK